MSLEVEAKLKGDSHDIIREKLTSLGAQFVSSVLETNHIFDNADRSLLSGGCGLRVRHNHLLKGQAPISIMTYKGPRQDNELKIREEIEIIIDDPDAARAMLEALGFIEVLRFEKRRETWRLNDCLVELDEVPHLGHFIEIEGHNQEVVQQTRQALNLQDSPIVCKSYVALLVRYCQEHNLQSSRITFEQKS